ncbi:hypothetical protein B0H10DRAFT_1948190 [Mycena sp. CBHHK59/15]|nr:hypothetical protein B0H10DRAFT_1948190 [Mycena sp. CBHHK59/15]
MAWVDIENKTLEARRAGDKQSLVIVMAVQVNPQFQKSRVFEICKSLWLKQGHAGGSIVSASILRPYNESTRTEDTACESRSTVCPKYPVNEVDREKDITKSVKTLEGLMTPSNYWRGLDTSSKSLPRWQQASSPLVKQLQALGTPTKGLSSPL